MSIQLINNETIIGLENRLSSLISNDSIFNSIISKSSIVLSSDVSRLTLENIQFKKLIESTTNSILSKIKDIENNELLLQITAEITRLTTYYLLQKNLLDQNFNNFNNDLLKLNTNMEQIIKRSRYFEYELSKIQPMKTEGYIGSYNWILTRVDFDYNANPNDFVAAKGENTLITLPIHALFGDVVTIANSDKLYDITVSDGIGSKILKISPLTIENYIFINGKWVNSPIIKNIFLKTVTSDYTVPNKQSSVIVADNPAIIITLPDDPIISPTQIVTIIGNVKIKSTNYPIMNSYMELYIDPDISNSITLQFNGHSWVISSNPSDFIFINKTYFIDSNNNTLFIDTTNNPLEIILPKNPVDSFSVSITDIGNKFSVNNCRVVAHHPIANSEDLFLELDIDAIFLTLIFADDRWLIKF